MLPDRTNLRVILRRVQRVSVLQSKTVRVIDKSIAVRYIVHEQRPEQISRYHWLRHALSFLDNVEEGLQGWRGGYVARPVVLAGDVDLVRRPDAFDVRAQFGKVERVVVVVEGVYARDLEMRLIDAVGAVNAELVWPEFFNVLAYLVRPFDWDVLVAEEGPAQLVAGRVGKDNRIFGVREARVRVDVR